MATSTAYEFVSTQSHQGQDHTKLCHFFGYIVGLYVYVCIYVGQMYVWTVFLAKLVQI